MLLKYLIRKKLGELALLILHYDRSKVMRDKIEALDSEISKLKSGDY